MRTMSANSSNLKFIFGIILIACGWVICFDLFLLIFGLGFFLLGTILVLVSKKSILIKSLTIGIPILLWFVGFEIILHEINKKTAILVVIPENFKGQVRVIYGEEGGVVPITENDRMVLNIPQNGILIIKPYLESGLDDMEFYFADASGKRTKLNEVKNSDYENVKRPSVLIEQGRSSEGKPGASSDVPAELDYIYDGFFVFANDSTQYESFEEERKNNPLTDSLVKVSRGIK